MEELFTEDELRGSTVRGKRGTLPALDVETMDAILCEYSLYCTCGLLYVMVVLVPSLI